MTSSKLFICLCIALCTLSAPSAFAAGTWSAVGSGLNAQGLAMTEYNGALYIGKLNFTTPDEINKWDGANLTGVGGGTDGPVGSFVVFNNELYVGGGFFHAGPTQVADLAKWNGTTWTAVGTQLDNFSINALAVYHGALYAGGYNINAAQSGPSAFTIAKWNGTAWVAVGAGLQGGTVFSLEVYNNELYASGSFTASGATTVTHIAKWNDTAWSAVGAGTTSGTVIYTVKSYGGNLYAGGDFTTIADLITNCLAKWNGTAWSKVGTTGNGTDNTVIALATYNNDLYIGGAFSTAGGTTANHIVKWNGTAWSTLGTGIGTAGNPNEQVWCIASYDSSIYAAGTFATAGGNPATNIAKWTSPTATQNLLLTKEDVRVYPNPAGDQLSLYIQPHSTGNFTLTLTDELGRQVLQKENVPSGATYNVDLSRITPGTYYLNLNSTTSSCSEKIAVKK